MPRRTRSFGQRVAIGNAWAAVSSVFDDNDPGADSGSVRMLRKAQGHWTEAQTVLPDSDGTGDSFGAGLALRGSWLAVGATNDDDLAPDAGAVYLFYLEKRCLELQAEAVRERRGERRPLRRRHRDRRHRKLVVGAPEEDTLGSNAGAAYLFTFDGTTWSQSAKLVATSFGGPDDAFGSAVDIEGGTVLRRRARGRPRWPGVGRGRNALVQVFSSWIVQAELADPQPTANSLVGYAVQLDGEGAIIGAPEPRAMERALLFRRSGTLWSYQATMEASDHASGYSFGAGPWRFPRTGWSSEARFTRPVRAAAGAPAYLMERSDSSPGGRRVSNTSPATSWRAITRARPWACMATAPSSAVPFTTWEQTSRERLRHRAPGWRVGGDGARYRQRRLLAGAGGIQRILVRAGAGYAGSIYFSGARRPARCPAS
jgi:hypothetical protein